MMLLLTHILNFKEIPLHSFLKSLEHRKHSFFKKIILCMCVVYIYVCGGTQGCMCAHVCVRACAYGGQRLTLNVFLSGFPPCCFRQGLSLDMAPFPGKRALSRIRKLVKPKPMLQLASSTLHCSCRTCSAVYESPGWKEC